MLTKMLEYYRAGGPVMYFILIVAVYDDSGRYNNLDISDFI